MTKSNDHGWFPAWPSGTLVYVEGFINADGIACAFVARVVEDLNDMILVQPLEPMAFFAGNEVEDGEEQDVAREFIRQIVD